MTDNITLPRAEAERGRTALRLARKFVGPTLSDELSIFLAALDAALAEPDAIARAVEAEREACAKVCETGVDTEHPIVKGHIMQNFGQSKLLARAIRARGSNGTPA